MDEELQQAIYDINCVFNDLIFEKGDVLEEGLTFKSDMFTTRVYFLGILIHNTDDDCREFYEGSDTYEPFEPYLRSKMVEAYNSVCDIMNSFNETKKY